MNFGKEDFELNYYYLKDKIKSYRIVDGDHEIMDRIASHIQSGNLKLALNCIKGLISYATLEIENPTDEREVVKLITQHASMIRNDLPFLSNSKFTAGTLIAILNRYIENLVFHISETPPSPSPIKSIWINYNEKSESCYINIPYEESKIELNFYYQLYALIGILFSNNFCATGDIRSF